MIKEDSGDTAALGEPRLEWTRQYERGKMARTLTNLLRVSRRELRRRDASSSLRLNWIKTICYITQTYNSLLRDVDYDEMREEMRLLQEKVKKLSQERTERITESNPADQLNTGQSQREPDTAQPC